LVAAFVTKAFCLERLGRFDEALSTYDAGIQQFPGNPELLTARGLLRLEHNMGGSIDDFRSAVTLFARSVWPYLELARNEFSQHKYDDALEWCRLGLERANRNRDADVALLFDLRALALFEKNDSAVAIERAFQTAVSLDPFNLAIRHNYERFLVVSGHPGQPVSGDWELSPLPIEEERRVLYQSVQRSHAPAA
jgi:tetratricopeptide (TPR) repeat protein